MKVYLLGAGPGDPGLLTLKARDVLARADAVVYDALANESLLGHARPDAELIYVGKVAGNHALPQHEINALLVRKAKEGKVVARLKGGDPYIFGLRPARRPRNCWPPGFLSRKCRASAAPWRPRLTRHPPDSP